MWTIEEVPGYPVGTRYLIRHDGNGGYLSNNGNYGGALHLLNGMEAQEVTDLLNRSLVRQ
jgi:hypothetical protein